MDSNKKGRPNPKAGTTVATDKHTGRERTESTLALDFVKMHADYARAICPGMVRLASLASLNGEALERLRLLEAVTADAYSALEERKAGEHR